MLINKEGKKVVDILRNCIEKANTGTLFFNNSFPEYDDEYVGKILSDFVRQDLLLRLSRGIYLKAKKTKFGIVYPTTEEIAHAIAERDNAEIPPVFLTSGSARKIKCGNRILTFKRGVPKNFTLKGKVTRLLVQAMKAIGERNYNEEWESAISAILSKYPEDETMSDDLKVMPTWIRRNIIKILSKNNHE